MLQYTTTMTSLASLFTSRLMLMALVILAQSHQSHSHTHETGTETNSMTENKELNQKHHQQLKHRRLVPNESIARFLQDQHKQGVSRPRFTLTGEIIEEVATGLFDYQNRYRQHQKLEYDIDVVEAFSSVTPETTYSTYEDGNQAHIPVGESSIKFLVADPHSVDFALIMVNEDTNDVSGFAQRVGERAMSIRQAMHVEIGGNETYSYSAIPTVEVFEMDEHENEELDCDVDDEDEELEAEDENEHDHNHEDEDFDQDPLHRTLYPTDKFPQLYSYQVDLYIEIDDILLKNNGGDMGTAIQYVNSLITGASSIYEREIDTHLHVAHIALTNHYKNAEGTKDALGNIMMKKYGSKNKWHYTKGNGIDMHHGILGQKLGGGRAKINGLCKPNRGFGISANNAGSLGNIRRSDFKRLVHEIGHTFGSGHTHSTSKINGYNPPVDLCGNKEQKANFCKKVVENSGTIMSYCNKCKGSDKDLNVFWTFGGYWKRDQRTLMKNWVNHPAIEKLGVVSKNPRRVPLKMWRRVKNANCVKPNLPVPTVTCYRNSDCHDGNPCTLSKCIKKTHQCKNRPNPNCGGNMVDTALDPLVYDDDDDNEYSYDDAMYYDDDYEYDDVYAYDDDNYNYDDDIAYDDEYQYNDDFDDYYTYDDYVDDGNRGGTRATASPSKAPTSTGSKSDKDKGAKKNNDKAENVSVEKNSKMKKSKKRNKKI